jgi:hypothetical protein
VPGCLWAILGSKMGGVQLLIKNLPRKQKKERWGRHGCLGQTEFARPSCEDAEFVCCEKNDDDIYFLQFVQKI